MIISHMSEEKNLIVSYQSLQQTQTVWEKISLTKFLFSMYLFLQQGSNILSSIKRKTAQLVEVINNNKEDF